MVLIVTIVAHYLNGGIQLQGPERRVTPAVKTHLSVLLGVLALIKAVDYYFQRLELVLSRDHVVNGATATSVHANKPALTLLIAIAIIAAGLFLYNIRQKGWMLPAVAVALWVLVYILVGAVYPALYQALRVSPSELSRETPYIQRNITATRAAYGLNNVQVDPNYNYDPTVTTSQIQGPTRTGPGQPADARQRAPARPGRAAARTPSTNTRRMRSYYEFNDLDLDRYQPARPGRLRLRAEETATIASVRELNTSVPSRVRQPAPAPTPTATAPCWPRSARAGSTPDGTPDFICRPAAHRYPCSSARQGSPDLLRDRERYRRLRHRRLEDP